MLVDLKGKGACAALFTALEAAGHPVTILDGVPIASNAAAAQAVIDGFTLDQAKKARCAEVSEYSGIVREAIMGQRSAYEVGSWPMKAAQARAFVASGDPAVAPLLVTEAGRRGISLAALVAKVQANEQAFSQLEAVIAGIDGMHRDAINALDSFADVAAYDIKAGWPSFE